MEGIRQMVRDLDAARVTAFTSVLNEDRGPHPIKNTWDVKGSGPAFCRRPNVGVVNQDDRIGDKSAEIRDNGLRTTMTETDRLGKPTAQGQERLTDGAYRRDSIVPRWRPSASSCSLLSAR